ncbi:hypothetical protein LshimejAT787_0212540 [Lyophyllum shimeji]|uniref:F-box domain-containing protein n=1 Tax=Lyophyllum shimeji TaxID=47721 RepID=A0A9P3PHQ6_LYOSH|nr:hypothetical protein LshimejAT787_0212540 [Lyophyllum shimeji]
MVSFEMEQDLLKATETQMSHLTVSSTSQATSVGEPRGIHKLPHEMLSEVFQHCTVEPAYIGFNRASTPLSLSQVCSSLA